MSENITKPGRFQAADPNGARVPIKINAATRRLAVQLFGCMTVGACIALAHATGDMSARLALILSGVVLAVGGFNAGTWHQRTRSKGGERNG